MAIYYFRSANGNWNSAASWSITDGGPANGAIPTSADDAYFTSNSGNCTVNTAGMVCKTLIFNGVGAGNYASTFSLTNTLAVSGSITLSSTMTFAGTSTLTINAASTITTNTKVFTCNITIGGTFTVTLGDDVYVNGNVILGGIGSVITINSNTLYCASNLTGVGSIVLGTSNVTMNGSGTLSFTSFGGYFGGTGTFSFNTTGTINISGGHVFLSSANRTIQYIAGNVFLPRGQSLAILCNVGITSLDLKGVKFYGNVTMATQGSISLISDFIIDGGTFTIGSSGLSGAQPFVLNSSGGNLYLGDQSIPSSIISGTSNVNSVSGTATIYIKGNGTCTFSMFPPIFNNMIFDFSGIMTIINGNLFGGETVGMILTNGIYTFLNGRIRSLSFVNVKNQGTVSITGNATLIGFDKFSGVGNIQITNAVTLTMDKFFSGRPDCISRIFCATTTGAYTITFQDTFEKFANWIKLSNCTLTRRGQLLVLNQKATTNTGRNTGVRYINSLPNGAPKDSPTVPNPGMTFGANGLVSDPAISL